LREVEKHGFIRIARDYGDYRVAVANIFFNATATFDSGPIYLTNLFAVRVSSYLKLLAVNRAGCAVPSR
jgi:hypothetical protein